jgi:hypothetical protein
MQQQQPPQMQIDLKNTTPVDNSTGGPLFKQGVILRKVSKFVLGTEEDRIMPIPVFYDPETGKIESSSLPEDLRGEYEEYYDSKENE